LSLAGHGPSKVPAVNCEIPAELSSLLLHRSLREELASKFSHQGGALDNWIWCRNYIRPLPLSPGVDVRDKIRALVMARNPQVGKYRLPLDQMRVLWNQIRYAFFMRNCSEEDCVGTGFMAFFDDVVRDLVEQSDFKRFFAEVNDSRQVPTFLEELLKFSQKDLLLKVIDSITPEIRVQDVVAAATSGRLEVLQSLCERIRDVPLVTKYKVSVLNDVVLREFDMWKDTDVFKKFSIQQGDLVEELKHCGGAVDGE